MIKSKTGNVDKPIYTARSLEEEIKMRIASDIEKEHFDFLSDIAANIKALKEELGKPGETDEQFIKRLTPDELKRISLKDGSNVVELSKYSKMKDTPKVKKLDLASHFELGKTVASLSDADKDIVKNLLKMSFDVGSKD
jgi:hypothetical protein|tara:strand:- start:573 stop:989 length:417 start_codon:yes stop_codon:yes gene_type:complete